jgi:hypothetical protein
LTWLNRAAVLVALLVLCAGSESRERGPDLEELEMEYLLEQATQAFEKPKLPIEQISADFKFRCLRAVGDSAFCDCLVKKRPYSLHFEQYVGIITRTKAELAYDTLSDISKGIVDKVYGLRDECVAGQ